MSIDWLPAVAGLSAATWFGLLVARGGFWRADQKLGPAGELPRWPDVAAVIPARNEAETISRTVSSLLEQDYPGDLRVIVVDDASTDGTTEAAGRADRLTVIAGRPLPAGWTGKLWAVNQGIDAAGEFAADASYLLLTDGDIEHHPTNLRELVWKAETEGRHLVSLMVLLNCRSFWERLLIPAFVFFFQKLYPFPLVNRADKGTAAAAGGCMLVRRDSLERAGSIAAIRDNLIDDCALAALIKPQGAIWLGLTDRTKSLRAYERLEEIWNMVARTAFYQLDHSVVYLFGTIFGMAILYLVPPLVLVYGITRVDPVAAGLAGLAWSLMTLAFVPTVRLYGMPVFHAPLLPVAGLLYSMMTVSSALRHWRGRGGQWKGRSYSSTDGK